MASTRDRRARLLRAIEAEDAEISVTEETPRQAVEVGRDGGWWDHLLTHFFGGDEDALFTDLRMNKHVFRMLVAAVGDIALAQRVRRGFIFSHQERVLFLHVFLAFGVDVVSMLLTPRIRTRSEIHRIAKSVCGMSTERLKELFVLGGASG